MKYFLYFGVLFLIFGSSSQVYSQQDQGIAYQLKILNEIERTKFKDTYKFVDSLLQDDLNNFRDLVSLAYPQKFDSIYNPEVKLLIDSFILESDFEKQGDLAKQIILLGSEAFIYFPPYHIEAFDDYPVPNPRLNSQTIYWRKIIENTFPKISLQKRPALRGGLNRWLSKTAHSRSTLNYLKNYAIESLNSGLANERYSNILSNIIRANLKTEDENFIADYYVFLYEQDTDRALWLLTNLSSNYDTNFSPKALVDALKHPHPRIVKKAIAISPSICRGDAAKKKQVHQSLLNIYNGDNEDLKFQACFALMHSYQDSAAFNYLLDQTKSSDFKRKRTAIYWVGDACHSRKQMSKKVYGFLAPHLASTNDRIRRAAVDAFATYKGSRVVRALIPFLVEEVPIIKRTANYRLEHEKDQEMLFKELDQYLAKTKDTLLQDSIRELKEKVLAKSK